MDNDHWRLTFYNNVNAVVLFLPLILIFEHQPIYAAFSGQFFSLLFWSAMFVAGFFGFSIGIVTVLQIKATSPLTHNISGTAKAAVQSMLAFYIWGNAYTFMGVLGIFTVLGGSLLYTFVKMSENKKPTTALKEPPKDLELQMDKATTPVRLKRSVVADRYFSEQSLFLTRLPRFFLDRVGIRIDWKCHSNGMVNYRWWMGLG